MQFDPTYKPNRDNLPPDVIGLMDKAFYRNRDRGFNVQFRHLADGSLDEWSFNSLDAAEAFAAKLEANGTDYALSPVTGEQE
jgi:hypothetical protein